VRANPVLYYSAQDDYNENNCPKAMNNTIFMIHGMWSGGWYWENYCQFFKDRGYRCLAPTLRLHDVDPKEPPHPDLGTVSLLDYVSDLENEIRKLDHQPIIMGHSMGGLLGPDTGQPGAGQCTGAADAGTTGRHSGAETVINQRGLELPDKVGLLAQTLPADLRRSYLLNNELAPCRLAKRKVRQAGI